MIPEVIEPKEGTVETAIVVPKEIRDRVSVGPACDWVKMREVDETFRHAASYSVLLYDRQHNVSRKEDSYRMVRRLETRQALQELGQWRLDFDPRTQHVVIHSLLVRREGVETDHARLDKFRFLQREDNLKSLSIDGMITLLVLLEDVRVGDLIDVSFTIRTTRDFLQDRSWIYSTIPLQMALRTFHLSVRFPAGQEMQWKSNEKDFTPAICEEDGETVWSWRKENLQLSEQEPNVPPWYSPVTWVQVTSGASWAEIAAGLGSAWREEPDTPELLRAMEEINSAGPTLLERVDRAMTMVQDDIRYLSVNIDLGGQIPSSPSAVLRRRYGDCKDKAFLLSHLLRLLGVKAWPVLVNAFLRQAVEELLPMPDAFNHAIVKYEVDGQVRWVDATLSLQGGGALSRLVPDFRIGLPLGPDIEGLEKFVPLPSKNDRYELREAFSLDSRPGHASIMNVIIKATGWDAENLRRDFAHVGEAEIARSREQFYRQLFPELQRAGQLKWEDNRERNECRLWESYDIQNVAKLTPDGRACMFHYHTHYIQAMLGITHGGKRKLPYLLPFPCNVEHSIEVETTGILNDNTVLPVTEQGPTFRFSCEQKRRGNRGVMTYNLKTLTGVIGPQQFEAHKKLVGKVWPGTIFYFRFPRGMPAPQRRPMGAKKIPIPVAGELGLARAPIKKVQLLSPGDAKGSRRKRRTKGINRQSKAPADGYGKSSVIIGVTVILVVAVLWALWMFLLVRG